MLGRNTILALTKDREVESPEVPPLPVHDPHDTTPLSPLSQSSSGYFSSSVSTATLSEVSAVASGDPAPLQPSSFSSLLSPVETEGLKAAETTLPRSSQQQSDDRNGVVASHSQYDNKMATTGPLTAHNHNSVTTGNSHAEESLEILLGDEDQSRDQVLPDWLTEGAYVTVGANKVGTVRYVGNAEFADGVWVGVELDSPSG